MRSSPSRRPARLQRRLGGWTSTTGNEGTCLPPLLCAGAENSFHSARKQVAKRKRLLVRQKVRGGEVRPSSSRAAA
jgi:hypothetical protein